MASPRRRRLGLSSAEIFGVCPPEVVTEAPSPQAGAMALEVVQAVGVELEQPPSSAPSLAWRSGYALGIDLARSPRGTSLAWRAGRALGAGLHRLWRLVRRRS